MVHRAPGRLARRSARANRVGVAAFTVCACLVVYALYFLIAYSTAQP